MICVLKL